jgi:cyclic pyranopterin monophosphate synthase
LESRGSSLGKNVQYPAGDRVIIRGLRLLQQGALLTVMKKLSHLNNEGQVQMVDVTAKAQTIRKAKARGIVKMDSQTLKLIEKGQIAKGNVLTTAKIAGIMAAKKTGEFIPLCHPLELTGIDINFNMDHKRSQIVIEAQVQIAGKTGVEMEALTAVSIAALTIYDMCKAVNKKIIIGDIMLLEKSGGKSGTFIREIPTPKAK